MRDIWELHRDMEVEHVKMAAKLLEKYEDRDAEELLPVQMPEPLRIESNVEYVRQILAEQVDYNAQGTEFVPAEKVPQDAPYHHYQAMVNAGGAPSESVIEKHVAEKGGEYRQELQGPHPVKRFRE